jgi:hypothetical protein
VKKSLFRWFALLGVALALAASVCRPALAERPSAPRLLPEKTLAYVRVTDTPTLVERFRDTSLGRIVKDEQVRPLVAQLYGSVENAWKQIEDRVGLPLGELLKIPQGEICVAFVAPPEQPPGLVVLLDVRINCPRPISCSAAVKMPCSKRGAKVEEKSATSR